MFNVFDGQRHTFYNFFCYFMVVNIIDEKARIKKYIGIRDRHLVEIINEKVVGVTVT